MIGLKANNVPMYPNVMDMFIFAFGTWFRWIAIRFFHLLSSSFHTGSRNGKPVQLTTITNMFFDILLHDTLEHSVQPPEAY